MSHAGVAQLPERPASRRKVAGLNPAPRSILLQAFIAGLGINARDRALGRSDGARGAPNRPPTGCDVLSYYAGYRDGELFGDKP